MVNVSGQILKVQDDAHVTTTDADGLSFTRTFTIIVTDQEPENSIPTAIDLSSGSVAENEAPGTLVGTFTTTDADTADTHTYTLAGEDAASFTLGGADLLTVESFDFETKRRYAIEITKDDGNGGVFTETFTITIIDVEENVLYVEEELEFRIYPNPATDQLQIRSPVLIRKVVLMTPGGKIVQVMGEERWSTVDISGLESGIYLLQVETEKGKRTEKIIIE